MNIGCQSKECGLAGEEQARTGLAGKEQASNRNMSCPRAEGSTQDAIDA
jgi:hypothetical protein